MAGVYTASSVTFRSHDGCRCSAAPDWGVEGLSILGDDWEGLTVKEGANTLGYTRPDYVDLPATRADVLQRAKDLAQDAEWEWGDRAAADAILDTVRWAEGHHRRNIPEYDKLKNRFDYSGQRVGELLTGKDARTVIHGNEDSFLSILTDGRIRNGYEVGSTHVGGGSDMYFSSRRYAESAYFGVPLDVDDALRPVYGYRVSDLRHPMGVPGRVTDLRSFSGWTGGTDVQWVLKPSWDKKTTLTWGDSLNTSGAPPVWVDDLRNNPTKTSEWIRQGHYLNPMADPRGKGLVEHGMSHIEYIEAQIYGGIPLDAIEKVMVDFSFLESEYTRIKQLGRGPSSMVHINAAIDEMEQAVALARSKGLTVEVHGKLKRVRTMTPKK